MRIRSECQQALEKLQNGRNLSSLDEIASTLQLLQPFFLDLFHQGGAIKVQEAGCLVFVPVGAVQGRQDELVFKRSHLFVEIKALLDGLAYGKRRSGYRLVGVLIGVAAGDEL